MVQYVFKCFILLTIIMIGTPRVLGRPLYTKRTPQDDVGSAVGLQREHACVSLGTPGTTSRVAHKHIFVAQGGRGKQMLLSHPTHRGRHTVRCNALPPARLCRHPDGSREGT